MARLPPDEYIAWAGSYHGAALILRIAKPPDPAERDHLAAISWFGS
jgi:hypothetical protein